MIGVERREESKEERSRKKRGVERCHVKGTLYYTHSCTLLDMLLQTLCVDEAKERCGDTVTKDAVTKPERCASSSQSHPSPDNVCISISISASISMSSIPSASAFPSASEAFPSITIYELQRRAQQVLVLAL